MRSKRVAIEFPRMTEYRSGSNVSSGGGGNKAVVVVVVVVVLLVLLY